MLLVLKTVLLCSTKTTTFHGRLVSSGEQDLPVPVSETFHEQTDEELTENDIKRMDANDQAIQTILLGFPEYVRRRQSSLMNGKSSLLLTGNRSNETYDFLKMNQDEVNELRAERLAKTHDPLTLMAHSQNL
ncbi:hypothetical protein Tco_1262014 [Tanacetum coccineum]